MFCLMHREQGLVSSHFTLLCLQAVHALAMHFLTARFFCDKMEVAMFRANLTAPVLPIAPVSLVSFGVCSDSSGELERASLVASAARQSTHASWRPCLTQREQGFTVSHLTLLWRHELHASAMVACLDRFLLDTGACRGWQCSIALYEFKLKSGAIRASAPGPQARGSSWLSPYKDMASADISRSAGSPITLWSRSRQTSTKVSSVAQIARHSEVSNRHTNIWHFEKSVGKSHILPGKAVPF